MKYPCNKSCKVNQKSICCDICQAWTHFKSTKLTLIESDKLGKFSQPYHCYDCSKDLFPYQNLSNIQLFNELTSNDLNQSTLNVIHKRFPEMDGCYLSVQDFHDKYANCKDFFILHLSMRSLNKDFEILEML